MSEGKRPGGLTALAIINFILAGIGIIGLLGLVALFAVFSSDAELSDQAMQQIKKAFEEAGVGVGIFAVICGISLVTYILLLLCGIGYLKQKKFLGRIVGNIYALLSIGTNIFWALMIPTDGGGGFHLGTIFGLIYPVLTLILINSTFKEDLVN